MPVGLLVYSSPESTDPGGWGLILKAGSVVRRPSVVRPSTISNDFSTVTKFHIHPPGLVQMVLVAWPT